MKNRSTSDDPAAQPQPDQLSEREPYEPPAVIAEETFETQALACNFAPMQFGCTGGGRS